MSIELPDCPFCSGYDLEAMEAYGDGPTDYAYCDTSCQESHTAQMEHEREQRDFIASALRSPSYAGVTQQDVDAMRDAGRIR